VRQLLHPPRLLHHQPHQPKLLHRLHLFHPPQSNFLRRPSMNTSPSTDDEDDEVLEDEEFDEDADGEDDDDDADLDDEEEEETWQVVAA
jgi:hypothetical protein